MEALFSKHDTFIKIESKLENVLKVQRDNSHFIQ